MADGVSDPYPGNADTGPKMSFQVGTNDRG